jgi:hypothetical protein
MLLTTRIHFLYVERESTPSLFIQQIVSNRLNIRNNMAHQNHKILYAYCESEF